MLSRTWTVLVLTGMWACGGSTFIVGGDGGPGSGSGSSSGGIGSGSGTTSSSGSTSGSGSSGSGGGSGTSGSGSGGHGGSTSGSGGGSGGQGSSGGGSGGGGSSGGSSGSGGGAGCPANEPTDGTACAPQGLDCEYGDNANPQCNTIFSCTAAGWTAPVGTPACPGGTCPPTFDQVPQKEACMPEGLDCSYLKGQCNCSGTLPVSTMGPVWQCSVPAQGCPNPRPRIGAACTQSGLSCDYGACTGGVELTCTDGYWKQTLVACPATTGG